jgi:hypothetical protein
VTVWALTGDARQPAERTPRKAMARAFACIVA